MEFEKWQALGNDYVIVEARKLPFELTAERIRAICASHTGIGADGILLLAEPTEGTVVASLRVFNPDGSEAEVSGNGAREAILYLRRSGWTGESGFSIHTAAGDLYARVISDAECTIDMGAARLRSDDFPSGPDDGRGELNAGGKRWRFRHVQVGNPQCAIPFAGVEELETLPITAIGPEIERNALFPNRTNVSWFSALDGHTIRARIFERGVGETSASGTGAAGAAVAHVLEGGHSPVTVKLDGGELRVDVAEDLQIALTGWALPVFAGSLAPETLEALDAAE